ncbi:MAG: DUF559 domain-containing protein [Nocardioides sp.]
MARDLETTEVLQVAGWRVLRFWEHESPNEVAQQIADALEVYRRQLSDDRLRTSSDV